MVGEARSVIDDESWGELGDVVDWSVRGKEREREREGEVRNWVRSVEDVRRKSWRHAEHFLWLRCGCKK